MPDPTPFEPAVRALAAAPLLLAIETAGSACSAAVTRGDEVLASERRDMRHGHGEALLPIVDRVVRAAGLTPERLEAVAAAVGPGGFTGIRVGLAAAHGIALAAGARLIGVSSFAAVAALAAAAAVEPGGLLVALDSRRDDLYLQCFAPAAGGMRPLSEPAAVPPEGLAAYLAAAGLPDDRPVSIAGDAAAAAAAALPHRRACILLPDTAPDARGVAAAALAILRTGSPLRPPRPLYLRPPAVTLPRLPARGAGGAP